MTKSCRNFLQFLNLFTSKSSVLKRFISEMMHLIYEKDYTCNLFHKYFYCQQITTKNSLSSQNFLTSELFLLKDIQYEHLIETVLIYLSDDDKGWCFIHSVLANCLQTLYLRNGTLQKWKCRTVCYIIFSRTGVVQLWSNLMQSMTIDSCMLFFTVMYLSAFVCSVSWVNH